MSNSCRFPLLISVLFAFVLSSCNPIAERAINERKRNAQNFASVYASAMAAGADLSSVKNKHDAIEMMRRGVTSYGYATTTFQVPDVSDKEAEQAARYILLDASGQLVYSDTKVP